MTLFEQYQEAEETAGQEGQEKRFDELSQLIADEGLKLVESKGKFVVCTLQGDAVTDDLDNLDEVEAWLDDPEFSSMDEDQEADYQEMTVAEADRFRKQFRRLEPDCRDMILKGLFSVDMEGRQYEYENAELRKVSMLDLYGGLTDAYQEQIRHYVLMLIELEGK